MRAPLLDPGQGAAALRLHVRLLGVWTGERLDRWDPNVFLAALCAGIAALVVVSLLTKPEPAERIESFFDRLQTSSDDAGTDARPLLLVNVLRLGRATAGRGWRVMWRDARAHASPNAGWPEAAMAGALEIGLGGPAAYDGVLTVRPALGDGPAPNRADARQNQRRLRRRQAHTSHPPCNARPPIFFSRFAVATKTHTRRDTPRGKHLPLVGVADGEHHLGCWVRL